MSQPLILAITQSKALREALAANTASYNLRLHEPRFRPPEEAVALVADAQPALVIADLPDPGGYLSHIRSDPATRRLPVLGIGEGEAATRRAQGLKIPCLAAAEFISGLPGILDEYARVYAHADELHTQCADSPPALVLKGLREFNAGEYFECHETLEHAWNAEKGPVRDVYRAILQVGVAYYHITRGNYNGARKLFLRSAQWFAPLPDRCQGIDIAGLRADAAIVREKLEGLGPERIGEFDKTLLRPIRFTER